MKAVILARVSSREQENGMSIDAQLENMNKYIQRTGLSLLKTFQITESSTKGDRKKFLEMLDFVKSQKEKIIIVVDCVDRVQRSFKESVELDELRLADKIEIHFLRENLIICKDSKSTDILRWDMHVMMAKAYVGNLRDNVKRSIDYGISQGRWQSQAPIGYLNLVGEKAIIIDPDRAVGVKRLFEEYSSHLYTLGELKRKVEQFGLTNKKTGKGITKTAIFNILNNPFYYGMMRVKGQLYPHIYEPIIDKALFDKCQDIMNGKNRARFKYSEKPFVFRGLIKCDTCGCMITSDTKTKPTGKTYTYLSCSHYKGNCTQKAINENILLEQIEKEVISRLNFPKDMMQGILDCTKNVLDSENRYVLDEIARLQKKQLDLMAKKKRVLDLFIDGSITQDEHAQKKNEIEEALYNVKVKLDAHAQTDNTFLNTLESLLLIASRAGELFKSSEVEQKRELINLLLSNCTLADGKLRFSLRKPFDALVNFNDRKGWLGQLDSNQYRRSQSPEFYH